MNILEKIVAHKRKEIASSKLKSPIDVLERSTFFERRTHSMSREVASKNPIGIISEIKRSSPSTGLLTESVDVTALSSGYISAGAAALSILTDQNFFGGSNDDLSTARLINECPILRKDFIISEYQVIEAKSIGADCILLIAACLEPQGCKTLAELANSLGLEVLLEVHQKDEIDTHFNSFVNLIGVNNRDLKTFETSIDNSLQLFEHLPQEITKISESGLRTANDLATLKQCGYDGFLIGGHFMKTANPAKSCQDLISDFQNLT